MTASATAIPSSVPTPGHDRLILPRLLPGGLKPDGVRLQVDEAERIGAREPAAGLLEASLVEHEADVGLGGKPGMEAALRTDAEVAGQSLAVEDLSAPPALLEYPGRQLAAVFRAQRFFLLPEPRHPTPPACGSDPAVLRLQASLATRTASAVIAQQARRKVPP